MPTILSRLWTKNETTIHWAETLFLWSKLEKDIGYFERTPDMIFSLKHQIINEKRKTFPHISYQSPEKE